MVYQECGTACPTTCDNKDEEIICTKQCVQGEPLSQTFYIFKKKKKSVSNNQAYEVRCMVNHHDISNLGRNRPTMKIVHNS